MIKIRLNKGEWFYEPKKPLGPEGGFGAVFEGASPTKKIVAVKRLKIDANDAAHRELRIAQEFSGRPFKHVMRYFDAGRDAESSHYFVVMPKAEKSLQDEIEAKASFQEKEVVHILLNIVDGLLEVPEMVHRDLKPGNVLFHEGIWKIADFGIARFVEESTSVRTLNMCLSPPYAAPEQWGLERASKETDIYSLGCISYCLLTGSPPFSGPNLEDYKQQHLCDEPRPLEDEHPALRSLVSMLLRKAPAARPSLGRVRKLLSDRLESASNKTVREFHALSSIDAQIAEEKIREEASREAKRRKEEARNSLAVEATKILREIYDELISDISRAAPNAAGRGNMIVLGDGSLDLKIGGTEALPANQFPHSGWDVVACAKIGVIQASNGMACSSMLLFAKARGAEDYRWWEVGFNLNPFSGRYYKKHIALDWGPAADMALSPILAEYKVEYGPTPIDGEDVEAFCLRWADLLGKAAGRTL